MNIAVTGSTGLIGSALVASLSSAGHRVTRLVRRPPASPLSAEIQWDPEAGKLDAALLEGTDAAVNLAGEPIPERWTAEKKALIRNSRVQGTRLLSESLARLSRPPQVLVNASAIGFYGDRGEETLTENSPPGSGFLAEVCRDWEKATEPAAQRGIRVVYLRTGIVLSKAGGALGKMLPPFRLGLGGPLGSGRQYMSWVALDDHISIIQFALASATLHGPLNAVAPNPATNREFTKALGKVLGRPTVFPMPAFAVRLAFGQMGEEALLSSARVQPARLKASGFSFRYPELEGALRHVLGR